MSFVGYIVGDPSVGKEVGEDFEGSNVGDDDNEGL